VQFLKDNNKNFYSLEAIAEFSLLVKKMSSFIIKKIFLTTATIVIRQFKAIKESLS
jgi:hypothetical protein